MAVHRSYRTWPRDVPPAALHFSWKHMHVKQLSMACNPFARFGEKCAVDSSICKTGPTQGKPPNAFFTRDEFAFCREHRMNSSQTQVVEIPSLFSVRRFPRPPLQRLNRGAPEASGPASGRNAEYITYMECYMKMA